ncbi:receptor-type tyrosine-protein phosphatase H-like [Zophobas morio]|uniref:receptor-type tyrosine-protein phosphatase H-like n=1 Tax=Zophobas morio TaxID=2755281 RepID=UPI003083A247
MNVVLWFIVILIHIVFAEISPQNEFSVSTGSNLTSYTNEDYRPTTKVYPVTRDEDKFSNVTKDVDSKTSNKSNDKLLKDENSDILLEQNNVISESGTSTDINDMYFKEFSIANDVGSSKVSDTTNDFSSSLQKTTQQDSIIENTLPTTDLSDLRVTDDENKNLEDDNSEFYEDPEASSQSYFSISSLSMTNTGPENAFYDRITEKAAFSYSSINDENISSTDVMSSTSPDYTYTPSVMNHVRACEIPYINFSNIEPYGFNVTLEWEASDSTCSDIEYAIFLNETQVDLTADLTVTISDLRACSEYTVSIAAIVNNETVAKSEPESFTTVIPDSFTSYGVQNLSVVETPEDTLKLTWEPPVDEVVQCVTNYYLTWWDANTETPEDSVNITETSYTLPLIGCMHYVFMIYPQSGANHNGHEDAANYTVDPIPFNNTIVQFSHGKTYSNITWQIDDKTKNRCDIEEIFVTCNAPTDQNIDAPWIIRNAQAHETIFEQNPNYRYGISIQNLSSFTNYTCTGVTTNAAGNSTETEFEITTDEDVPSEPLALEIDEIGPTTFRVKWQQPAVIPGIMTSYGIRINASGSQQQVTKECSNNVTNHHFDISADNTNFTFDEAIPYYKYQVSIYGTDGAGNGTEATTDALTASAEPDSVANARTEPPKYSQTEEYKGTVKVVFDPPCNTNGPFKHYAIRYNGTRTNLPIVDETITTTATEEEVYLLPERNYSFTVTVVTENFTSLPVDIPSIQSQAGVPILTANMTPPEVNDTTKAYFTLPKSVFNNENGEVIAYSLILMNTSTQKCTYGFWQGTNESWPSLPENGHQLTPNFWNPFEGGVQSVDFIIGKDSDCSGPNYCNQALNEGTKYWLIVRALTSAGFKDSSLLHFETEMPLDDLQLPLILGLIFGLLLLLILIGFLFFLWRRRRRNATPEEEKRPSTNPFPAPVPVQKFISYYASIKEDYNIIRQQFIDLGLQSKEYAGETTFAILPENKRKNRYTNILPFDATRVSLKIDEDDEISSDYINASYIKGYTGKVEYIATQGPLELTARDFWKMILQENVTVIAMVSQFVEQTKEKCFHYFPNNHENVYFGESLEVKCTTELHFGTYCVRTLQVRKNTEQRDVVHMQFLEWPDFGVPQGTDNMLQFCTQLREKVNKEGGLIAVHCSAGVGRTGTLIAADILLQTIDDHRDINIYKTVLDLRKQRTNMVQTEKQYMFIHTCIKDYIETPPSQTNDTGGERIYENMDVIRSSSLKKNLIESEIESAL